MSRGKAAVFFGPGKPFELRELPLPEVEPDAVLIRVALANVCGSDLHFWRGDAPLRLPDDGWIFGHEMTGRVSRLGARVQTDSLGRPLREGDRVAYTYFYPCGRCYACLANEPAACPAKIERPRGPSEFPHFHGAFAEYYYLRPRGALFLVPDALPDEMVAPVNCALSQVIFGLGRAGLAFGGSVVIQGAGGLGIQAAAVARDMGAATVIVVDQLPGRLELARAFGADHTINLKEVADRKERVALVRTWTGGGGADVVCDFVGFPQVIPEGIEMLRSAARTSRSARSAAARRSSSSHRCSFGVEEDRGRDPVRSVGHPPRARLPCAQPGALPLRPAPLAQVPARKDQSGVRRLGVAQPGDDHDHARGPRALINIGGSGAAPPDTPHRSPIAVSLANRLRRQSRRSKAQGVARRERALGARQSSRPLQWSCAPVRVVAGCLPPWPMATSGEVRMAQLLINGKTFMVDADPATPLLWVIRERLQLTGTKFGCGIAQCGACTVHLDGAAVRSCQTTLAQAAGKKITTIEGLHPKGEHPLQKAWIAEQVPQCGYCQSGQIMQAAALLAKSPNPTDEEIVAAMSGNICRCARICASSARSSAPRGGYRP